MATPSATSKTAILTLAPATLDTVTLTASHRELEVKNWGANRLSFKIFNPTDGATNTPPVADAQECEHVGPGEAVIVSAPYATDKLQLISTAGTSYSVRGIQ